MKWSTFIISCLLLFLPLQTLRGEIKFLPSQFVIQNAGNMGTLSAGISWNYGHHKQWETDLLIGYFVTHTTSQPMSFTTSTSETAESTTHLSPVSYHTSSHIKPTLTLKENFIPWNIDLKSNWKLAPLTASFYINSAFGHEFWASQPALFPKGYYKYISTKYRLNLAVGQRFSKQFSQSKHKFPRSLSLFYEVSSCDIYIHAKAREHTIPLKDILSLSLGIRIQTP